MDKAFTNFEWKNSPDTSTPLNATNLNKLNNAIDEIDDRVIALQEVFLIQNNITLSTSGATTVIFTNSAITTDSTIDVYTKDVEIEHESINTTTGSCSIVFPKQDATVTISVKIYIR